MLTQYALVILLRTIYSLQTLYNNITIGISDSHLTATV